MAETYREVGGMVFIGMALVAIATFCALGADQLRGIRKAIESQSQHTPASTETAK